MAGPARLPWRASPVSYRPVWPGPAAPPREITRSDPALGMAIIMPLAVQFAIGLRRDRRSQRAKVGRDPFRSGPIAAQEFGRVTPLEGRLVEECGTRRDECRCARCIRVNGACSIDQIQPRPREGHVELLGMAVSRGQALDSGSQAPKGSHRVHSAPGTRSSGARGRRDETGRAMHSRSLRPAHRPRSCGYLKLPVWDGPLPTFSMRSGRACGLAGPPLHFQPSNQLEKRISGGSQVSRSAWCRPSTERRHEVVSKVR